MATYALDFEKPLLELETKLAELKRHAATGEGSGTAGNLDGEIRRLEKRCARLQQEIFNELSRWQVVQLSRHPNRPYMLDYVQRLFTDWAELHGDRSFGDDQALIGGLARFDGEPVMLIGQQKGRSTKENIARSFGMPRPEGYRKALRLMKLAERFGRPVIAFIDTPGAYPGIDAEERGQAEAIAVCLEEMAGLLVPVVSVVIGEGGSGGALAIGDNPFTERRFRRVGARLLTIPRATEFINGEDDRGATRHLSPRPTRPVSLDAIVQQLAERPRTDAHTSDGSTSSLATVCDR